ncbi:MAG TPA: uroporphyrinogen-III synthase [Thermoanaerobaculia bacterium]|nr:uroporphyrinogen-III synthase [Thermoanaerobaculia bacterium]
MSTSGRLAGVRVVVTRAEHQAQDLAAALEDEGAVVETLPLIEVVPPTNPAPLADAARRLPTFDHLILTSGNAVEALFAALEGAIPGTVQVTVIGSKTAAALEAHGRSADLVAEHSQAEGLLEAILPVLRPGERVLLPQAADARPVLAERLIAERVAVESVVAYRKRVPEDAKERAEEIFASGPLGWVTFTAPSIVRNFRSLIEPWDVRATTLLAASIGPVTSRALRHAGVEPAAEATEPSSPALVEAIAGSEAARHGQ